jgi:hypothetical protein
METSILMLIAKDSRVPVVGSIKAALGRCQAVSELNGHSRLASWAKTSFKGVRYYLGTPWSVYRLLIELQGVVGVFGGVVVDVKALRITSRGWERFSEDLEVFVHSSCKHVHDSLQLQSFSISSACLTKLIVVI